MLTHGLTSIFIATALSTASPTKGPSPSASAVSSIDTEVEIEIVERGGGHKSSVGFVVPIEGEITAWVDRSTNARRCEVEVDKTRAGVRMKLECGGGAHRELRVEATRGLTRGKRVRIAEVTRAGGSKSQVFATLR